MNKSEHARRSRLSEALQAIGFTVDEVEKLRRISKTLHRWHELECGTDSGCIERDDATGRPYWVSEWGAQWGTKERTRRPIADRETGARRRLAALLKARNERAADELGAYIQTDPRGAALYILRSGDVPEGSKAESCYTRGICVH